MPTLDFKSVELEKFERLFAQRNKLSKTWHVCTIAGIIFALLIGMSIAMILQIDVKIIALLLPFIITLFLLLFIVVFIHSIITNLLENNMSEAIQNIISFEAEEVMKMNDTAIIQIQKEEAFVFSILFFGETNEAVKQNLKERIEKDFERFYSEKEIFYIQIK